jgi:hypothetical protein
MITSKVHVNSRFRHYLTDFLKDSYEQVVTFDVIPEVRPWKYENEDLVIMNVDPAVMSIDKVDFNFWLGFHFAGYLTIKGVKPTNIL